MTAPADLIALVKQIAPRHALDPGLVCAVIEQETNWHCWDIRYEPDFQSRYVNSQGLDPTSTVARSISWGGMQIMGETAREFGFAGPFASLCDPATGIEVGCMVLAAKLRKAGFDMAKGLQFWNGGSNPLYAAQVMARMANYA